MHVIKRQLFANETGRLLKAMDGYEDGVSNSIFGEIYTVEALNGAVRANHYHKDATEWFTLLRGAIRLVLIDTVTLKEEEILLSADSPQTVVINPLVAHAFRVISMEPALLLAYTNCRYDPSDTYAYEVIQI